MASKAAKIVSRWGDDGDDSADDRPKKKSKKSEPSAASASGTAAIAATATAPAISTTQQAAVAAGAAAAAWAEPPAYYGCRSVECYEQLNLIDEGQFGVVYRAADRATGRIVALKRLKMEREVEGYPITSLREIQALFGCRHPNIVDVLEIVRGSGSNNFFMVMEYVDHELRQMMIDHDYAFSMPEIKRIMIQLLDATAHMHRNWIMHRDLKTANILYSNSGAIKVADFGLAREFGDPLRAYSPTVVTLWYRAPELLLGMTPYTSAIDMWSVGIIMAELMTRDPLIKGEGDLDQLRKTCNLLGTPTEAAWPALPALLAAKRISLPKQPVCHLRASVPARLTESGFDLLSKMLTWDPERRITAAAALAHPWFEEAPLPQSEGLMPTFASANEDGAKRERPSHTTAARADFVLRA